MEDYKQSIIGRGYEVVGESCGCTAFINQETKFCAILAPTYVIGADNRGAHDCHDMLKKIAGFAEKSTICVIEPNDNISFRELERITRNEYHFVKVSAALLYTLPNRVDKNMVINFEPMRHGDDRGDYTVNPFDKFDGKCSGDYIRWLANDARDGDTVKYPPIINSSFFRYHAEKLYKVLNHD